MRAKASCDHAELSVRQLKNGLLIDSGCLQQLIHENSKTVFTDGVFASVDFSLSSLTATFLFFFLFSPLDRLKTDSSFKQVRN